jgi:hypothetical protein
VPRIWVVLLAVAVLGCSRVGTPAVAQKPGRDDRPRARHDGLIDVPPLVKRLALPSGNGPYIWPYSDLDEPAPINALQAVRIAEEFVRDNGYTDFVPPDASKLVAESIEWEGRDQWIANRHNQLRSRALGYLGPGRYQSSGWLVAFRPVEPADRGSARGVSMDEHGRRLRMEHKDVNLKLFKPRPVEESK